MTRMAIRVAAVALAGIGLSAAMAVAAEPTASLKQGKPDLKSAGPLTFGPEGILFVGDTKGAALFAIDTGDRAAGGREAAGRRSRTWPARSPAMLGTDAKQVQINDLAVNPRSGNVYLSVSRGRGPDAIPVIVRINGRRQARGAGARQRPVRQGRDPQRPGPRRRSSAARTCGTSRSPTWPMSTAASSWPACRTRNSPRG